MIRKDLLLEDARNKYLHAVEVYSDVYEKYMVRYDGDEELVRSLLFSLEQSKIDAELDFYSLYFSRSENKLALYRYFFDYLGYSNSRKESDNN